MAAIEVLYGEPSWLRLVPGTFTTDSTSEVSAIGPKYDFLRAIKASPTFVGAATSDTKTKYFTTDIANGNKLSTNDNSKNVNVFTGETINEDSASGEYPKLECSVVVTPAQRAKLVEWYENGNLVIGSREIGKNSLTGLPAGYEYLAGSISELKENVQKGPSTMDFSIIGKKIGAGGTFTIKETVPGTSDVVVDDYNDLATGATNTITPHEDGSARTIIDLTSDDWTKLLTGKIVSKLVV